MSKTLRALGFVVGSTGTLLAFAVATEGVDHVARKIDSVRRIANLVRAVSTISADYAWEMKIQQNRNSPSKSKREVLQQELLRLQLEQESNVANLYKAREKANELLSPSNENEMKEWEAKVQEVRFAISRVSDELAVAEDSEGDRLSAVHTRSATRLRDMCASNGGVYIKLGQHISMLDYVVPSEYQRVLSTLLANTPRSSWESVQQVVREELGQDLVDSFQHVDKEPIASASLAQVHVATGKDGKKYAVKVQHAGLSENTFTDMAAITVAVHLVSRLFEGFDYNWLCDEMNKNIPMELDFRIEASNLHKCERLLQSLVQTGQVAFPHVYSDLSSRRVLTMSFEDGCYVTDVKGIEAAGLKRSDVSATVSRIFCEQM